MAARSPSPDLRSRHEGLAFGAIVLLAFALRFAYLLEAWAVPLFDALIVDARAYWEWSDRIAAGDWRGETVFYQAPLYPYFLAVLKLAVGADLWSVRSVQIALGSLACGVLYLAGTALHSRAAGLAAGLLLALYPPAIFLDSLIQKTSLGLLWMSLLLLALATAQRRPAAWRFGACGALLGLLVLTREESLLLAPVLALWTFLAARSRPRAARARGLAAFALGLALVLAPVVARNYRVGGELVLTTTQAGTNFYIGNGPKATGIYVPLVPGRSDTSFERADAVALAEAARGRALTPREVSAYWFDAAFAQIRAHPGQWLALLLRKLRLLLNWYEVPDAEDLYFFERSSAVLRGLGGVLHFGVLLPLAAAGIALTFARRRELAVVYLVLATQAVGVLVFYLMARYRYPLVPGLALLAGAALAEGFERARARRFRSLLPAAAVCLALLPVSNADIYAKDAQLAQSYVNSAVALAQRERHAEAADAYREALRLEPAVAEIWDGLGAALRKARRPEEAIGAFEQASALRPDQWRYPAQIGSVFIERGDFERARGALERATQLEGAGASAWRGLAQASAQTGRQREAVLAWRRARALDPVDREARLGLAFLLATCPDPSLRDGAEALALAQGLARERPDDIAVLDTLAAAQAETGAFEAALATIRRALALAEGRADAATLRALRARAALYAQARRIQ